MKYGMLFANVGPFGQPDVAAELGAICEETGIESVWTVEHVVVPEGVRLRVSLFRGRSSMAGGDDAPDPRPTRVAHLGRRAHDDLAPCHRHPDPAPAESGGARQGGRDARPTLAGRVILGIGVGWLEEEFDALGVPFAERAARTDEYVEVMRALWSGAAVDFDGEFTHLRAANSFPHPAQPTVPIVVGGHSKAAARRAGRLGDGFFPAKGDFDELHAVMRAAAVDAGRDPDAIEITRGGAMDRDSVARMADEGCDRFVIPPLAFDPAKLRDALGALRRRGDRQGRLMAGDMLYDRIGEGYASTRRSDPQIRARIHTALGDARRVVNVGAGAGSYEPTDREVVAVDPSTVMLGQREPGAPPAVRAVAEALPFPDCSFDVAMAILTLHHWSDQRAGIAELRRVAARAVVFTFDMTVLPWIATDYLPEMIGQDAFVFPPIGEVAGWLDAEIEVVPVPRDCTDGFAGAYWARPELYLDPVRLAGMSCARSLDPAVVAAGVGRLRADLASGAWDERHGHLRELAELDLGYRLLVSR